MGRWRQAFIQGVFSPGVHSLHSGEFVPTCKVHLHPLPCLSITLECCHYIETRLCGGNVCILNVFVFLIGSTFAQLLSSLSEPCTCAPGDRRRAGEIPEGKTESVKAPLKHSIKQVKVLNKWWKKNKHEFRDDQDSDKIWIQKQTLHFAGSKFRITSMNIFSSSPL